MSVIAAVFRFYPEKQNQPQEIQGTTEERRHGGGRLLSFSDEHPKSDRRPATMAHQHPPRFLKIVDDAKQRVRETSVDQVKGRLDRGEKFVLVDVREDREFDADHLPGAVHMGKGVIERDVEGKYPDLATELVLYCGGGFRSALAADNLQKMGYTNVISMDGGIRDWRERGYPLEK
jgi:rhodanese-related sulfurtransferase